jgi:L-aspartate oxidase
MEAAVGVVRDRASLEHAVVALDRLSSDQAEPGPATSAALAGFLIAAAAFQRRESRGAHFRRDHPEPDPAWRHPTRITLGEARALASALPFPASGAMARSG